MADGAATTQPKIDNGLATSRPAGAAALPEAQHHDVRRDEQIQSKLYSACTLKDRTAAKAVVANTCMEIGRANKDWEKAWNEIDRHATAISEKHNMDFRDFVENQLKMPPEELDKSVQRGIANNTMRPMRPEAQAIPLPSPREVSSYYGKRVPEEPHRPDEDPVSFRDNIKRTRRVAAGLLAAGGTKIEHQAYIDGKYNYTGENGLAVFQKGGAPQGPMQQFAPGPSAQGSGLTWDPATGRPVPAGYAAPEQAPTQQAAGPLFTNQEAVRNSVQTTDAGYHQARQGHRLNVAADNAESAHDNKRLSLQKRTVHTWMGYLERAGRIGR